MALRLQLNNSTGARKMPLPVEFITICAFVFITAVSATTYFCRSMSGEMKMPGGWALSMIWMRMPGETWTVSALNFLLMWLSMMIAMMMPSALPMFLKTGRRRVSLRYMASGYFAVWLLGGTGVYLLGVAFAIVAVRSELFSHAVPWLSAALLIAAGAIQFTRLKLTQLRVCRSATGCASSSPQTETSFWLGCKQGTACCLSCSPPLAIQLVFGLMNPLAMILVAIIILVEKLLPKPEITTRLVGIAAFSAGFSMLVRHLLSDPILYKYVSCPPMT